MFAPGFVAVVAVVAVDAIDAVDAVDSLQFAPVLVQSTQLDNHKNLN